MNIMNIISTHRFAYRNHSITIEQEDYNKESARTPFQKDYDRVIFSNSFRRLSKKTQVHPLSKNDHVHNRMTHSIETASVGRSLGMKAGEFLLRICPEMPYTPYDVASIIQTACLAHDIGNPPFGHAGEEVIKEWFKNCDTKYLELLSEDQKRDFQSFDGNAQSVRTVCRIEHNDVVGMGLTFATIASMVKYPWSASSKLNTGDKFSFFQSEADLIHKVFVKLELIGEQGELLRHPFSYLMEMADDICYALLDLQDAIELEILTIDELENLFIKLCGKSDYEWAVTDGNLNNLQKAAKLVAYSMNNLTQHASFVFEQNFSRIKSGEKIKDLFSLFSDNNLIEGLKEAKSIAKSQVFNEKRKIQLEIGAYNIIGTMLDNLIPMAYEFHTKDKFSFKNQRLMNLLGENSLRKGDDLYTKYQKMIDYIVGMTDNYATYTAHQMSGMGY